MKKQSYSFSDTGQVCLVAILLDEEKFLDEWLVYHKMIGIDHFFLYDDNFDSPLLEYLSPHQEYVTVIPWKRKFAQSAEICNQISAYRHALKTYLPAFEWTVFLDADEFVVLRKHKDLKQFLSSFEDVSAISLNWHVFGHSGYYEDPSTLVTTALTRRMYLPSEQVKSISRVRDILNISYPHYCELKSGKWVDANGEEISLLQYHGKTDNAHINHYICRSFTRWMSRPKRGDVNFHLSDQQSGNQWRFDEELCLKEFVESIAKDKNEFVDTYMQKYRYDIYDRIIQLNRDKTAFDNSFALRLMPNIERLLQQLASILDRDKSKGELGLQKGDAGVALFLFEYSLYSGNDYYRKKGMKIIEDISFRINKDSEVSFNSGLAGFGLLIEYLVKHCFLRIDTNEYLEDVDHLINYHIKFNDETSTVSSLLGLGKYYVSRLGNPFNDRNNPRVIDNTKIINEIFEIIAASAATTYEELCNVIDFVTDSFPYLDDKDSARQVVSVKIEKLEAVLSTQPKAINPLVGILSFLKVANALNAKSYREKAMMMLDKYKSGLQGMEPTDTLINYRRSQPWVTCLEIYQATGQNVYLHEFHKYVKAVYESENRRLSGNGSEVNDDLFLDGRAVGVGMILLCALSNRSLDFIGLCPMQ